MVTRINHSAPIVGLLIIWITIIGCSNKDRIAPRIYDGQPAFSSVEITDLNVTSAPMSYLRAYLDDGKELKPITSDLITPEDGNTNIILTIDAIVGHGYKKGQFDIAPQLDYKKDVILEGSNRNYFRSYSFKEKDFCWDGISLGRALVVGDRYHDTFLFQVPENQRKWNFWFGGKRHEIDLNLYQEVNPYVYRMKMHKEVLDSLAKIIALPISIKQNDFNRKWSGYFMNKLKSGKPSIPLSELKIFVNGESIDCFYLLYSVSFSIVNSILIEKKIIDDCPLLWGLRDLPSYRILYAMPGSGQEYMQINVDKETTKIPISFILEDLKYDSLVRINPRDSIAQQLLNTINELSGLREEYPESVKSLALFKDINYRLNAIREALQK